MARSVSVSPPAKRAVHAVTLTTGQLTSPARMLPGFLIVGAQRCGTTSMYRTLSQHPAIVKSVLHKGVHYFDMNYGRGRGWYRAHFPLTARPGGPPRGAGRRRSPSSRARTTCSIPWLPGGSRPTCPA